MTVWAKYLVAISFVYLGSVNVPKFAILLFYHRLFPLQRINVIVRIMMGFLVLVTVVTLISACALCRPFAANWDPTIPGAVCANKEAFFIWASFPNMISDVILLALPMPVVWKLHATTRLKIGLTFTFAVGSL
jgi:hypothetical protein